MRLIFILLLIPVQSLSQNWQLLNSNRVNYYSFSDSLHISNIVSSDSIDVIGSDTTFHLNKRLKKCDTCTVFVPGSNGVYYHGFAAEFMGHSAEYLSNENVYLINNDTLHFAEQASFTWDFNGTLSAEIVSVGDSLLFSALDSIKTIELSNGDSIIISESFGILQYPEIGTGNHWNLVGYQEYQTSIGEYLPNIWSTYDFEVGDVFCYHIDRWAVDDNDTYNPRIEILENLTNQDEISYRYRMLSSNHASHNHSNPPWNTYDYYYNWTDTLKTRNSIIGIENMLGGIHPVWDYYSWPDSVNFYDSPFNNNLFSNYNDLINPPTGFAGIFWKHSGLYGYIKTIHKFVHAHDSLFYLPDYGDPYNFRIANNLGRISVNITDFEYQNEESLQSFQTNWGSYGSICNYPEDLAAEDFSIDQFIIFPNPSKDQIKISIPVDQVDFYSMDGKLVLSQQPKNQSLNIDLEPGVYIIIGTDKSQHSYSTKLVVNE